jgi:hypothetical protein
MDYSAERYRTSLDILDRTVMIAMHPLHGAKDIANIVHNVDAAARVALGHARADEVEMRQMAAVDAGKFDSAAAVS